MPTIVGSFAMVAAASGALTMPSAGAAVLTEDPLSAGPQRPEATSPGATALGTVVAASRSLTAESTESMQAAHRAVITERQRVAAARAARREREAKRWVAPVADYRVSASFGSSGRLWSGLHTGIDLATSYGAQVRAMSTGEIIFSGYDGAYGNKIVVRHWDGTETWYAHLSRIVQRSGKVTPGEVIGAVGTTGNSTGSHLHLEIRPAGADPVNPRSWLAENGIDL